MTTRMKEWSALITCLVSTVAMSGWLGYHLVAGYLPPVA